MKKISLPKKYIILIAAIIVMSVFLVIALILSRGQGLLDASPELMPALIVFLIMLPVLLSVFLIMIHRKKKRSAIIAGIIIIFTFMLIAFLVMLAAGVTGARPKLVFASGTQEKVYDGQPLTCDEWRKVSGKLKDGHTAVVTVSASRTDAGVSENTLHVMVVDKDGEDVSEKYDIIYRPGQLRVSPIILSIVTGGAVKLYDGTELTCDDWEWVSGDLLEGHSLVAARTVGRRTDAGISDNIIAITVTDADGATVTQNYKTDESFYGKLEVLKRPIGIITGSAHSVYDGKTLTCDEWAYASDAHVLAGHDLEVTVSGSQTDAGISTNFVGGVRVTEGSKDITANYDFTYFEGDLMVSPRYITIRSGSAKKPYDGKPLTQNSWDYASETRVAGSETIKVIISGTRTELGTSPNTIAQITVRTASGKDVTYNYVIKEQEGTLTIGDGSESQEPGNPVGPGNGEGSDGLDSSGKIGSGTPPDDEKTDIIFRVYSELSAPIYLRLMSYGDYAFDSWEAAAEYPYLIDSKYSLNYMTGIALGNAGYYSSPVSIESPFGQYILPYYLDTDEYNYDIQTSDVVYTGDASQIYSAYYYLFDYASEGFDRPDLGAYAQLERQYYEYVKQNYLAVPSGTNTFLQDIIAQNGFDKNNANIVRAVEQYIQSSAVYNLDYDVELDNSADIVTAFLGSYKEGTCTHFASSATLLYRALGIPARYVIGAMKQTEAGEWVEITVGHAWTEVYISGLGWVYVEATPAPSSDDDEDDKDPVFPEGDENVLRIKPVDIVKKFENGIVLNAISEIQGIKHLLDQGYTYSAVVTGRQSQVGIGYSTIQSFILYDPDGDDVTDSFNIVYFKGKLHLYVRELTVKTDAFSKAYDGTPLKGTPDGYTLEGGLIGGHIPEVTLTGLRINAGQSQNVCNIKILDGFGADVSYMYNIIMEYGMLTVEARVITVTAGSATKAYDGTPLTCTDYSVGWLDAGAPLVQGDTIAVTCGGSQTAIGRSQNIVTSVVITDKNGRDVTSNYAVQYVSGQLVVTR